MARHPRWALLRVDVCGGVKLTRLKFFQRPMLILACPGGWNLVNKKEGTLNTLHKSAEGRQFQPTCSLPLVRLQETTPLEGFSDANDVDSGVLDGIFIFLFELSRGFSNYGLARIWLHASSSG